MNPKLSTPTETPGAKLRRGRRDAGMTQRDVAAALKCTQQSVHALESECNAGSRRLRLQMAELVGIDLTPREVLNLDWKAPG